MGLTKAERYNRNLDRIWDKARENGAFEERGNELENEHQGYQEYLEQFGLGDEEGEPLSFSDWLAKEEERALWKHEEHAEDRGTERE